MSATAAAETDAGAEEKSPVATQAQGDAEAKELQKIQKTDRFAIGAIWSRYKEL